MSVGYIAFYSTWTAAGDFDPEGLYTDLNYHIGYSLQAYKYIYVYHLLVYKHAYTEKFI